MNIAVEYIKYLWKAKKRHGVHSPFIYGLTDKCLEIPIDEQDLKVIREFRQKMKHSEVVLSIDDCGAGSKTLDQQRRVKDIFKTSSSKGKYGELLYRICRHYRPGNILELGTSLGTGTIHMHLGNPDALVTSVEGCNETADFAVNALKEIGTSNIKVVNSTFSLFFQDLPDEINYDLVFIDGHHDGKALIRYLDVLTDHIHNDSIIILDDIRWSQSMFNAWNLVEMDAKYHVTIDLFRMGIILLRNQQQKEQFTLRL